jgi:hypothetical protein
MRRDDVSRILGENPREFHKGFSKNLTESYSDVGIHLYYDSTEAIEFIEAFPPCRPTYDGVDLMRSDAQVTLTELAQFGLGAHDDGEGGLWFEHFGFALYAPGGRTEGVSIFRRGYDTGA